MDKIYLVMDFIEHDLKALMESMTSPFAIGEYHSYLSFLSLRRSVKLVTGLACRRGEDFAATATKSCGAYARQLDLAPGPQNQ